MDVSGPWLLIILFTLARCAKSMLARTSGGEARQRLVAPITRARWSAVSPHIVKGDSRDSQQWDPLMVSGSHIIPISLGILMGVL